MVVTKAGLLFQNGKDGWARAYDVDTGKVLWKGKTAGQSIGIPAMYESQGPAVRRVHVAAGGTRPGWRRGRRRHGQRAGGADRAARLHRVRAPQEVTLQFLY